MMEVKQMAVKYNKLWKILMDKSMKSIELQRKSGISSNVLASMGKDKYVSMESIDKICQYLCYNIEKIMDIVSANDEFNQGQRGGNNV